MGVKEGRGRVSKHLDTRAYVLNPVLFFRKCAFDTFDTSVKQLGVYCSPPAMKLPYNPRRIMFCGFAATPSSMHFIRRPRAASSTNLRPTYLEDRDETTTTTAGSRGPTKNKKSQRNSLEWRV